MNRRFIPFAITLSVLILVGACIDTIPTDPSDPEVGEGSGLRGSYFDASGSRVVSRVDPVLDFDWAYATPDPQLPPDRFSVVWTGEIEFPSSGEYELIMNADDGVRLFIDGSADLFAGTAWVEQGMEIDHSVTRSFSAGRKTIRIEYFENEWNAGSRLSWQGPGIDRQIVPSRYLYPGAAVSAPPEGLPFGAEDPSVPAPSPAPAPSPIPPPSDARSVSYTPMPTNTFIMNPERGWYGYGSLLDERMNFRNFYTSGNQYDRRGLTLATGAIRLDDWRSTDTLPDSLIEKINRSFADARTAGVKLVMRVSYNGNPDPDAGDAPLHRVLGHIEQLGPVFRENYDVIAVLQAGFIGEWGEWHSSTNGLHHDTDAMVSARTQIIDALFDHMVHEDRMLQLRYPRANVEYATGSRFTTVDPTTFSDYAPPDDYLFGSDNRIYRIGMYNDCLLTGTHTVNSTEYITDVGTYEWETNVMRPLFDLSVQYGRFTPMGGETCHVRYPTARADCDADGTYPYYGAVHELDLLGYDYLNLDFHRPHHDLWQAQGCYDEVTNRFGYRFSLLEGTYSTGAARGSEAYVSMTIRNDGFGKLYNPRPIELVMKRTDGVERRFVLAQDARLVLPLSGETKTIDRGVSIPNDMPTGTYRLYLALPDGAEKLENNHRYSIRLANPGMWTSGDSWDGLNDLGFSVTIT